MLAWVSLLLGVLKANYAANPESSSAHWCQGLTADGTIVLFPDIEQFPPSPSDLPEMPCSERNTQTDTDHLYLSNPAAPNGPN